MPKVNRSGQSEIFTETDFRRLVSKTKNKTHRIIWFLLWYTGERVGAVTQLCVSNVYEDPRAIAVRSEIIYPANSRKKDPSGISETRSVPMHTELCFELERYKPPIAGYLFPSPFGSGHISRRAVDQALRRNLEKAKLHRKGYSTHSFRRTFITDLHRKGASTSDLKAVTGHKSISSLERYIQNDPSRKAMIINLR
jgi:integrase/recombinase XerD